MRRIRKIGALVLLSFALSAPLYANMPVIDISAIAEGISQFMTTIEQYNRQIQQWKSEYDKMVKAAKAIATGDFNQIMNGIAQFANQFASWDSTNKYADSFLRNVGSAAKLTATINDMSQSMGDSLGNAWNWVSSIQSPDDIWEGLEGASDFIGGVSGSISKNASTIGRYSGKIADLGTTISAIGTQLDNGALGVSDEELEEAEKAYQEAIEAEQNAYKEYQDALRSASDTNDISIKQLEDAYLQKKSERESREEQLNKQRETRNEILDALYDARDKVNERVSEMKSEIVGNMNDDSMTEALNSFQDNSRFKSFG